MDRHDNHDSSILSWRGGVPVPDVKFMNRGSVSGDGWEIGLKKIGPRPGWGDRGIEIFMKSKKNGIRGWGMKN